MPEIGQSGSEGGMAFGPSLPLSANPDPAIAPGASPTHVKEPRAGARRARRARARLCEPQRLAGFASQARARRTLGRKRCAAGHRPALRGLALAVNLRHPWEQSYSPPMKIGE